MELWLGCCNDVEVKVCHGAGLWKTSMSMDSFRKGVRVKVGLATWVKLHSNVWCGEGSSNVFVPFSPSFCNLLCQQKRMGGLFIIWPCKEHRSLEYLFCRIYGG